jgi:hypothetical protein
VWPQGIAAQPTMLALRSVRALRPTNRVTRIDVRGLHDGRWPAIQKRGLFNAFSDYLSRKRSLVQPHRRIALGEDSVVERPQTRKLVAHAAVRGRSGHRTHPIQALWLSYLKRVGAHS